MSSDLEQQLDAAEQRVITLIKSILNLIDGADMKETLDALMYVVSLQMLNYDDEPDVLQHNIKIFGENVCKAVEFELKKMQEMKSQLKN